MAENYTVTLPHYSVGPNCYDNIGEVTHFLGKTAAVVGGETALEKAGPQLRAGLEKAGIEIVDWFVYGKDATMANVERITSNEKVKGADMIFGVGRYGEARGRHSRQALPFGSDRGFQLRPGDGDCGHLQRERRA